ncbi:MAG: PA14 domain-containing protein [Pirellulales bacterium]
MKSRCSVFLALLAILALAPAAYAQIPGMTGIDIGPSFGYDPGSDPLPGDGFVDASTGDWVVWGGGSDIWNNNDSFHYEYATTTGDFQATVRTKNIQNTSGWAKAGIMARNELVPSSVYALSRATPGNGSGSISWRDTAGGGSGDNNTTAPNSNMGYPGVAPIWQRLTRVEQDFFTQWAPDVNGAPGKWSFPLEHRLTNATEAMYLGLAVTANNTSRVTEGLFDNYAAGAFVLDGPEGGAGYFGVREVVDNGNMDNETLAVRSLLSPTTGSYVDYRAPVVNIWDSGGHGQFPGESQHRVIDKEWRVAGLVDNIALIAKGKVNIPEADTYTFAVQSDDGFRLWIDGKVVGSFEGGRGNGTASYMPVDLTAGKHSIQLTYHEGGGGSAVALAALRGVHTDYSDRNWRLVGDSKDLVIPPGAPAGTMKSIDDPANPGVSLGNFAIKEVHRTDNLGWNDLSLGGDTAALANAKARLDAPDAADMVYTGYSATVNFNDPDNKGGEGSFGSASRSPIIGDTAMADDDNFAMRATGTIVIPTAGDYSFGVHSDDGFSLKIAGATFSGVVGGEIDPANADTIQFPLPTGDSNTIGHVTLAAGEYPIQFDWFEINGGAFAELSASTGFKDAIDNSFVLLGGDPREGYTIPGGLELVGDMVLVAGDANKDGRVDVFDVAVLQTNFGTTAGATWEMGDFNSDGKVDVFDVGLLQPNFGYGVGGSANAVPEPASLVLAGLGFIGLLAYGLRRRKEA